MAALRTTSNPHVRLRECDENDDEALYRIFVASHGELSAAVSDWDEAHQEALLMGQFQAQQSQYRREYPDARFDVIEFDARIIGNFYVAPGTDETLLIDINLLPEYRNQGIGRALLRDLLAESESTNKPVSLHVMRGNPAVRLYQRLGFVVVEEQDACNRMEWRPAPAK